MTESTNNGDVFPRLSRSAEDAPGGGSASRGGYVQGSALVVDPLADAEAEWDDFVHRSALGTFCHLAEWRRIMSTVFGHECHYAVARDEARNCLGILPLVRVRSRVFGDYLLSMPFLNYGGPIGSPDGERALCRYAERLARQFRVNLLELRSRHSTSCDLRTSTRKVGVILPLPESPDQLLAGFSAKLRSQIRRPLKEGMEFRFGVPERKAFYGVFARNMRDLGTPVLPEQFFEEISGVFPREAVFGAVYFRGQPVAAGCGFVWRQEFEMTWASSLREHNRLAPNMLLYWAFMRQMIECGIRVFNFGRCTPGSGTHRFKLQWGAQTVDLPWRQWSTRECTAPPSPDRAVFRYATRLWSRMPLAVANVLGPLVARSLP